MKLRSIIFSLVALSAIGLHANNDENNQQEQVKKPIITGKEVESIAMATAIGLLSGFSAGFYDKLLTLVGGSFFPINGSVLTALCIGGIATSNTREEKAFTFSLPIASAIGYLAGFTLLKK